ncbi:unnamed protein product [Closterium sp. Yama58-4]|nr:unnamed protein product [Closterium sp. Yama58-4]
MAVSSLPAAAALTAFRNRSPGERELSPELKAILEVTAVTGTVWHDWESVRELLGFTISQVLEEYETERVAGVGPPRPLPSGETFAELSERILSYLEAFTDGPPFTIQRICSPDIAPHSPEFAGFFREVVVEEAVMELGGADGGGGSGGGVGGGAGGGTAEGRARSSGGVAVGSGSAGGSSGVSSGGSGGGEGSGGGDAGSRGRGASGGDGREARVEVGRIDERKEEEGEKEERGGSGSGAGEKGEGGSERVREGGEEEEEEEEASKWLVDNPPPVAFGPVSPTREESREGRREEGREEGREEVREEEKGEEEMKGEGGGEMKVERGGDIRVECEEKAVEGEEDGDGGSGEGEDLAGQEQGKEGGEADASSAAQQRRRVLCMLSSDGTFPPRHKPKSLELPRAVAHGFHHSSHDLDEEEKQRLIAEEIVKIEQQTKAREEQLKRAALKAHLDHELRFGKIMFSQAKYTTAIAHFDKVLGQSEDDTYHHGEASLQKAACLEKLGAHDEARRLYKSLCHFRGADHHIKRRAAQALFEGDSHNPAKQRQKEQTQNDRPSLLDDYMYKMFLTGFGNYTLSGRKQEESRQERMLMQALPWMLVLMAPAMVVGLMLAKGGE